MFALAWWTLEPRIESCCSAGDSLHLRGGLSDAGGRLRHLFSRSCGAGVYLLHRRSLNANVNLVFAGDEGWLVVADIAVKTFEFRVIAVYAPNTAGERRSFFRRLEPFLDDSKQLVLMGDWNAILDPKVDKGGRGARGLGRCESSLIDFLTELDFIDRFRLDHPGREMWTWMDNLPSGQVRTYLDRVLGELTLISLVVPRSTG